MKNNDEMYQSVLVKLDAHLERQERKKLYLKRNVGNLQWEYEREDHISE